ncbi:hypothetical protein [Ruminiclostridium herbifermentans]|uniref:hypothetical protein n=1 Tax=Ruminiclostridium herbifermentans TaxID=2488810 RepID=UPI001FD5F161|nr:hypothetical protein [Ruminiclostridium herbifermentans]
MNRISLKTKIAIAIFSVLIDLYCCFIFINMYNRIYWPASPQIDLLPILKNSKLSEQDYSIIFSQTGLSKLAIDDLLAQKDGKNLISSYQKSYFTKRKIYTEKLNPFTSQENIFINKELDKNNGSIQLAPLKNGDILFTKSTHTLYWRHGHCGLVVDAKNGIVLESIEPGTISKYQKISKWQTYSTLKVLRLKNADQKELDEIAKYADKNLIGLKYGILASKKQSNKLISVNCSQIIYQAYKHFGYDIDSNQGLFITPEDIAKSNLLSIVQIYGFNPEKDW